MSLHRYRLVCPRLECNNRHRRRQPHDRQPLLRHRANGLLKMQGAKRDAACASASVAGSYASASASATSGPDLAAAFAQAYASMTGGTAFAQAYTVASDPEWMEHKPDPMGYPGAFSPYCRACRKWATSDHLRTPRHERMVAWRVHY